jgi:hypothetical protein
MITSSFCFVLKSRSDSQIDMFTRHERGPILLLFNVVLQLFVAQIANNWISDQTLIQRMDVTWIQEDKHDGGLTSVIDFLPEKKHMKSCY